MNAPSPTVLVTGANGFLGSHLVEHLVQQGVRIRCLVRATSDIQWLTRYHALQTVEVVRGSLSEEKTLDEAVAGVHLIFHLAAAKVARNLAEFLAVNAGGTQRLAEAAKRHAPSLARFVYVSSAAAIGPSRHGDRPLAEDAEPRPVSDYGTSKLEGERVLINSGLPYTIVRPPAVYGPRDKDLLMFFRTVAKGFRPVLGGAPRYLTLLHVDDVVDATLAAASHPASTHRTYTLGDGRGTTWEQLGELVARLLKRRTIRLTLPLWAFWTAAAVSEGTGRLLGRPAIFNRDKAREAVHHWVFSGENLARDTGFRPRYTLETGLQHTLDWYRHAGWL